MFTPTSTITVANWMLQTVNTSTQRQRAQALTDKGNEHASALWGEQTTETANFTLGGNYQGNMTLPALGNGITDYTVTYSETDFPKLDVTKNSAAGGGTFTLPFTLPARTIGVPSTIASIFTALGTTPVKQLTIAVSCQHAEEPNGSGVYGTLHGMRDATVTVTFTGTGAKPTPTMAAGWDAMSDTDNDSNSAVGGGTAVYVKHFPIGTDADAANAPTGGSGTGA